VAYSSTRKMEATCFSKTFSGLYGLVSQKREFFEKKIVEVKGYYIL
jgi:hypothetical protein